MENVDTEDTFNAALHTIQIGLNSITNLDNKTREVTKPFVEKPYTLINTKNDILPAEVSVYTGGMFKTIDEPIIALLNFLGKSKIINILVDAKLIKKA